MFTDEELKERINYIGASEAAAVLGLSKYKTVLQIWAEKTGETIPEDISAKTQVRVGTKGEQMVAELFTEDTGKKVHRVSEAYVHAKYDFIRTHIDRKVEGEDAYLECKVISAYREKEFDDNEIPADMLLQCYHGLNCTNYKRVYLAVLVGNHNIIHRTIERNEKIQSDILKKEVEFWTKYVIPKEMPFIISKDDADTLYALFPDAQEKEIELGDEADIIAEHIKAMQSDYSSLEGQIEQKKNELKALLKDADTALTTNYKITWKKSKTKRIDSDSLKTNYPDIAKECTKTTEGRTLRISVIKEDKKEA